MPYVAVFLFLFSLFDLHNRFFLSSSQVLSSFFEIFDCLRLSTLKSWQPSGGMQSNMHKHLPLLEMRIGVGNWHEYSFFDFFSLYHSSFLPLFFCFFLFFPQLAHLCHQGICWSMPMMYLILLISLHSFDMQNGFPCMYHFLYSVVNVHRYSVR